MGNKQIRIGQLIAPFGPGSLYTDRRGTPHIVCGLDHWFMRWDQTLGLVNCESRADFEKVEPRLSALLNVDRFCVPPDFRHIRRGAAAPPNAMLNVPAQRFPRWYRHTRTGEMRRFNLHTTRIDRPQGGGRWQTTPSPLPAAPVRDNSRTPHAAILIFEPPPEIFRRKHHSHPPTRSLQLGIDISANIML